MCYIMQCEKTFKNRLEFKVKGPPPPNLALIQECSRKCKSNKITRVFNPEQYKKTPWLCGCEKTNRLFCFPCLLFGNPGCDSPWTEIGVADLSHLSAKIKKHTSSRLHLLNEVQLASIGVSDSRSIPFIDNLLTISMIAWMKIDTF